MTHGSFQIASWAWTFRVVEGMEGYYLEIVDIRVIHGFLPLFLDPKGKHKSDIIQHISRRSK